MEWFRQVKASDNIFRMFDLGAPRKDNNRWSVRMKSTSFRTARKGPSLSVRKFGTGLLLMGLALTASAKDGSSSVKDQTPNTQAKPKNNTHKPRRWLQVGVASWYGTHFQGRETAAGGRVARRNTQRTTAPNPPTP